MTYARMMLRTTRATTRHRTTSELPAASFGCGRSSVIVLAGELIWPDAFIMRLTVDAGSLPQHLIDFVLPPEPSLLEMLNTSRSIHIETSSFPTGTEAFLGAGVGSAGLVVALLNPLRRHFGGHSDDICLAALAFDRSHGVTQPRSSDVTALGVSYAFRLSITCTRP